MPLDPQTVPIAKKMLWAGRITSALPTLFLLFDGVGKLVKPASVVAATIRLGYPESVILGLGGVLIACTVVHLIPLLAAQGGFAAPAFCTGRRGTTGF